MANYQFSVGLDTNRRKTIAAYLMHGPHPKETLRPLDFLFPTSSLSAVLGIRMHFQSATRLCFLLVFACGATGQRIGSWASPQTSIWNSGSSFSNNVPSSLGSWGSNKAPATAWSANTYSTSVLGSESRVPASNSGNDGNSKWGNNAGNNFDSSNWSSNKQTTTDNPRKQNSNNGNWKSDAFSSNKKQGEKKLASITNWSPETSKVSSNNNANGGKNFKQTSGQNSRPNSNSGNWNSNSLNTNEVFSSEEEEEDNNVDSWNEIQNSRPSSFNSEKNSVSGNRKPQTSYDNKRTENSYSNSNNNFNNNNNFNSNNNNNFNNNNNNNNNNNKNFNSNSKNNNNNDNNNNNNNYFNNNNNNFNNNINSNKKTSNDRKPSKDTTNWNSDTTPDEQSQSGPESPKKTSSVDLSILDELDKNDWYFGKESDYPRPPFKTNLNIDVSELWNVQPQRQTQSQSFRETSSNNNRNKNNNNNNNNNKRRRNREIRNFKDDFGQVECECVSVTECNEDDMILSQENIANYGRPLEDYICEDLTEVCCTNPYPKLRSRTSIQKGFLECGQRKVGNDFESFGDDVARPGEFPWSLQLDSRRGTNCSASLIHPQLALTAGHCVQSAEPDDLKLTAGVWNTNDESSQARRVARVIIHPEYDGRKPRNDIALLVLENPFELTDNVNTVCLPVTNDIWDPNRCFVAGWKPKEINGEIFQVFGKTEVGFLPQSDCQDMLLMTDIWRYYILHDSFACGIDKTGTGSCLNGEGGAVVCPSGKSFVQVGIVSDGVNCDKYGRPGIFTDVLRFLDWIHENAFDLGFFDDIGARRLQ